MSYNAHPSSIAQYPTPDLYECRDQRSQPVEYSPSYNISSHSIPQHHPQNLLIHTYHPRGKNSINHVPSRSFSPYMNFSGYHPYRPMLSPYRPISSHIPAVQVTSHYYHSFPQQTQMHQPYSHSYSPVPHYTTTKYPLYSDTAQLGSAMPYYHNHLAVPYNITTGHQPYYENSQLNPAGSSYAYSNMNHLSRAMEGHLQTDDPYISYAYYNRSTLVSPNTAVVKKNEVKCTENKKKKEPFSIKEATKSKSHELDFSSNITNEVQWEVIFGELPEIVKLPPLFPELESASTTI